MACSSSPASRLPAEIWDMICSHVDMSGSSHHPRHGSTAANWGGQKDLKALRLLNRTAWRSASRLIFRSIGQKYSDSGIRSLSELADSSYAPSVRAVSIDIDDDLAINSSSRLVSTNSSKDLGSILARLPNVTTICVMTYSYRQGPRRTLDWNGVRTTRANSLATQWIEAIKNLETTQLQQLNLVFENLGQMKQFAAQLNVEYPEGAPDSWFHGCMIEEASAPLSQRAPHDVCSIFSVMPLRQQNTRMSIAGSLGHNYTSYRQMQYISATPHIEHLQLVNAGLDGDCLERILLANASTLKSIELYGVTLRTAYWATIFTVIQECCEQLEDLQVGCLGYLLPISSTLDKLSPEDREDKIARDAGALTSLAQVTAGRRWNKGLEPQALSLLCSACEAEPTEKLQRALGKIAEAESRRNSTVEEAPRDTMLVTNDEWKDMLWLHGQLWEG